MSPLRRLTWAGGVPGGLEGLAESAGQSPPELDLLLLPLV